MRETFIDILHSRYYGNLQMFSPRTVALTSISITLSKRDIKSEKKRFDVSTIFFIFYFIHTHTQASSHPSDGRRLYMDLPRDKENRKRNTMPEGSYEK